MTRRLEDTVVLVTGSSSGIGAATARRLAYIVTRQRRVAVNEILVRATGQT